MRTKAVPAHVKAVDETTGEFEAIVAVFGNLDHYGDRILPGAFAGWLEKARAAGDPVPVIFSHRWDDLDAHLGEADPANIRELEPGDPALPPEVADLGGLYVKGRIDVADPPAAKVARLLKGRRIREFSFAYDVPAGGENRGEDGANELSVIDPVFEVGPTLVGANPATQLIAAKSRSAAEALSTLEAGPDLDELQKSLLAVLDRRPETKAQVQLSGSIEVLQDRILSAVSTWAEDFFQAADIYWIYLEATYVDHVIFYVELWDDPPGAGRYFSVGYTADGDSIELVDEPAVVEIVGSVEPKARRLARKAGRHVKEGRRNAGADLERIQGIHDLTKDLGAECDTAAVDPEDVDEADGDPETSSRSFAPADVLRMIDLEETDLDLETE